MKLERVDPRVKLALLIALSTASLLTTEPLLLAAWLLLTAALLLLGGVGIGELLRKARAGMAFIFSIFVLQCLFNRGGEPLLQLGGLTLVTDGGVRTGLYVGLRLLIILFSALILMTGTRQDYLLALNQLGLPYEISFMILAGLRFLPFLREAAQDVLYAVQMRGGRIHGAGLRQRLRLYMSIVLPVVALAIRRSEKLSTAMEARAFCSQSKRTFRRRLIMKKGDWLYLTGFCAVFALLTAGVKLL
ncbi:MAG: energy-coupling factor transporter transmembrane protein EcfT [Firmicutes bacterium]|nr:energy-coupling factor transporter transmembrane protein EcfT [Bacillota bacterium]